MAWVHAYSALPTLPLHPHHHVPQSYSGYRDGLITPRVWRGGAASSAMTTKVASEGTRPWKWGPQDTSWCPHMLHLHLLLPCETRVSRIKITKGKGSAAHKANLSHQKATSHTPVLWGPRRVCYRGPQSSAPATTHRADLIWGGTTSQQQCHDVCVPLLGRLV